MRNYQVIERKRTAGVRGGRVAPPCLGDVEWRDTAALVDQDDVIMAVAIGPDGMVWSYSGSSGPDGQTPEQSAYLTSDIPIESEKKFFDSARVPGADLRAPRIRRPKLRCTHLCADTMAVGFDQQDRPVVFAALGTEVHYVTCMDMNELQWSPPTRADLDIPESARGIECILSQSTNGRKHVGAMIRVESDQGPLFNAAYAVWDSGNQPTFKHTPVYLDSLDDIEVGALLQKAADSCYASDSTSTSEH